MTLDGLRLAVGTLTALPVAPPRRVDRHAARVAMLLAPLVGFGLGLLAAAVLLVGDMLLGDEGHLVTAAATVAVLALATRGMHLDGLADTADGLGVRRGSAAALAAMRDPAVGAFGVVTVCITLLLQVAALDLVAAQGTAAGAVIAAVVTGRASAALACLPGIPSARPDGLGATVAGVVPRWAVVWLVGLPVGIAAGSAMAAGGRLLPAGLAVVVALAAAHLLVRRCARRLGGITGDVIGACVEVATTGCLLGLAVAGGTAG